MVSPTPAQPVRCVLPGGRRSPGLRWVHAGTALAFCLSSLAALAAGDCFEQAGTYQGVNPTVLRAIVWFESKGDPRAVHRNADGSVDIGQAQINSIHFGTLAHYGVPRHALTDACVNIYVAAWLLKQKMVKHGNTWRAIGAYHSETPAQRDAYARSIQRVLVTWGELKPGQ
ncbi:lytic transglycosylase domain-containing protein [Ralstonia solanacearum]|uniref:Lytic transglycosylase, catalytic protein n=1 Tax=Ralstonia solanacearum (strain Po82) TaxID=1031711 RepID=F6FYA9_RALS8|nr:lytic transglycosylase domain-containing protein [Ralstonia solanacearum]AEG67913.1 lytic transglycosylase, catalytic protein [Ralstonia solanacearum Po82]AMP69244.1 lytic transglycosylase [Ralstonia solanacearum]AMP73845.1 lytic transglycosylase [Ralstonia solanacearum]AYB59618.1 lytic transglycosylase [Ralstonia solanacearum]MBB6586400.1 lytic transglycosylase domain-containing protein [Ralstonia solanacearum]